MLIDEAEKLFGGYQSSASTDSGTLSRVLAQLLQFLQEDNTGVITIMTSNNVFELPPELLRSGRLDAQWYFGFPSTEERKEILDIYLKKNRLEVTSNIFNYIIRATKNYSGAEIKEIVKNLLIKSYFRQKQEGKEPERVIIAEDAKAAIAAVVPVYQTSKEKVDLFVEMAKGRYRIASATEEAA
jgi:SpoVK/Ycf46/Vps4 family AAA+-type ATPase